MASRTSRTYGLVAIVAAISFMTGRASSQAHASDKPSTTPKAAIEVYAEKITSAEIYDPLVFGGFVEAGERAAATTEVDGTVLAVDAQLGDHVKRGQVLARVRPQGAGFEYQPHTVVSPISGLLTELKQHAGDRVQAGSAILMIENVDALKATVHVTYSDLLIFHRGTKVSVAIGHDNSKVSTEGIVESVSPKADTLTGTYPAKVSLSCTAIQGPCVDKFRIGALVRVTLKKNLRRGIKVPIAYLQRQHSKVIILEDSTDGYKARWIDVKVGTYYGKEVEIVSGLTEGMMVVSSFAESPEEGDIVKVVQPSPNPTGTTVSNSSEATAKPKG